MTNLSKNKDLTLDQMVTQSMLYLHNLSRTNAVIALCTQWLMNTTIVEKDIPTMATDGVSVFCSVEFARLFSYQHRAQAFCHEALHGLLTHCEQMKHFGPPIDDVAKFSETQKRANMAMDVVINALVEEAFGERFEWDGGGKPLYFDTPKLLTPEGRKKFNVNECDFYWVIRHLDPDGGGGKGKPGAMTGGDVITGDAATQAEAVRQAARAVAQFQATAKQRSAQWGDTPGWMGRFIHELQEPKCNWKAELWEVAGGTRPLEYSYRKQKRPYSLFGAMVPTCNIPGIGNIGYFIDTSGSITEEDITLATSELFSIWKVCKPDKIYVLSVDADVHNPLEIGPFDDFKVSVAGGGGTSFRPPFDWIEKNAEPIEMAIYVTDGYGDFPPEPEYPVIWVVVPGGLPSEQFPFGRVIRIDQT